MRSARRHRKGIGAAVVVALTLGVSYAAWAQAGAGDALKRGEYLVTFGGCHDCHTPLRMGPNGPEPDMTRALSGHPAQLNMPKAPKVDAPWFFTGSTTMTAFAGPWGVTYAINLTPDEETGLGHWTEKMFVDAMRTGKHAGVGRPILPPMPWRNVAALSDADLKALFAYLKSIKPIKNMVPAAEIAPSPAP
jgi:mono/diheme cytochrome c family protein